MARQVFQERLETNSPVSMGVTLTYKHVNVKDTRIHTNNIHCLPNPLTWLCLAWAITGDMYLRICTMGLNLKLFGLEAMCKLVRLYKPVLTRC